MECVFKEECPAFDTDRCNAICPYFLVTHGEKGTGGFWGLRGVPKKYDNCMLNNLPADSQFEIIKKFIKLMPKKIEEGVGLYLFSAPTKDNPFGTGNGKTTSACAILNEWTKMQCGRHTRREIELTTNPALFVKASDFQNLYNSQFRGSMDMTQEASMKYYRYKQLMKEVQLLVIDDIAMRSGTEAYVNEMYEVIDHRAVEELATIFTSNVGFDGLKEIFGDRIASRIEGMSVPVSFKGRDFRKKVL